MAYLYVLQCQNFVKIGVSKTPNRRIKQLQTGNPYKIYLLLNLKVEDAYQAENFFHKKFKNQNSMGEWFEVNSEIKQWVIDMKQYEYMQKKRGEN